MVGWCFNAADTNQQIWICFEIHYAVVESRKITTRFLSETNNTITHMKGLQRTTPDRLGALSSIM